MSARSAGRSGRLRTSSGSSYSASRVGESAAPRASAFWARSLVRKRTSPTARSGWRLRRDTPRCAPPVEPAPRGPRASRGSGAIPTRPRTLESRAWNRSIAYGQFRRKIAWPSPKARRESSSSAAVVQAGLSPEAMSPAWTTAADEELSRRAFGDGHAIFLRNWPYAMDLFQARDSRVRGRVGIAPLPRLARGPRGAGSTGGAHLGVSRRSRHPDLAVGLVRFLTSERAQKALARGAALSPTREALYDDPELVRSRPDLPALRALMRAGRPRPVTPYYLLLSATVQPEFSAVLVDVKPPGRAIGDARLRLTHFFGALR